MAVSRSMDAVDPRTEECLKQLDLRIDETHIGTEAMDKPYDRHAYIDSNEDLWVYFAEDKEYKQITLAEEDGEEDEVEPCDIITVPISIDRLNNIGYREYTYTTGKLTKIEIWEDSTKAVELIAKDITWDGDKVDYIEITDYKDGSVLKRKFTYSGSDVINIAETITTVGDNTYNWDMPLSDGDGNILIRRIS